MLRRPFILSAVVVTALLALAASAAYTRPLSAVGRRSGALPSSLFDYTFTTVMIVAVVAFIVLAPLIPVGRDPGKSRPHPARALRSIGILAIVVLLLALVVRHLSPQFLHFLHLGPTPAHHVQGGGKHAHGGGGTGKTVVPPAVPRKVNFRWDALIVLSGLGLLLVLLAFGLRSRGPGRGAGSGAETLEEAISESLDDLRTDSDLRRAIVAAYARMERALAATGAPRDPAEAPHEYLERALLSVDASAGAARRLTELFERAKFSQHEPDSQMRDVAIDALEAVRDELRVSREVAA